MTAAWTRFDPILSDEDAATMQRVCERFADYRLYGSDGVIEDGIGKGLLQRQDAALHFVMTGGRFGRREDVADMSRRTNLFRETFAYAGPDGWSRRSAAEARKTGSSSLAPPVPGIGPLIDSPLLAEAARALHGRPVIVPTIVYANLLLPGQELAVHTDVGEYRGISRAGGVPEWLIVVMRHSGLFERWRMHVATAVSYFGTCDGGEFAFWPDGVQAAAKTVPVRHNTAVLLDTDSVFHAVDRVGGPDAPAPPLEMDMVLRHAGDGRFTVGFEDADPVGEWSWGELRYSVSWKAYCYADEAEQELVRTHADDLDQATVVATLIDDLRRRGRIGEDIPDDTALGLLMIEEYVRFPAPTP